MTPEEAISAAFRAASREIALGMTANKAAAYQGFLVQTSQTVNEAARAFALVAENRPTVSKDESLRFEMHAYNQAFQSAISAIMALGHFPYLDEIKSRIVEEKLS